MCVVLLKFVAALSKCWVPIFRQSKLSTPKKKHVRFFYVTKKGDTKRKWDRKIAVFSKFRAVFRSDAQIFGNVENHQNKFEQKCWDSRCLGDKTGFNDSSRIFTSAIIVVAICFLAVDDSIFSFSMQKLPLNNGKPARFLQVNWIQWELKYNVPARQYVFVAFWSLYYVYEIHYYVMLCYVMCIYASRTFYHRLSVFIMNRNRKKIISFLVQLYIKYICKMEFFKITFKKNQNNLH